MPLTANTSHLRHEAKTRHTWSPAYDTTRYQAIGSTTYKQDAFSYGDTSDTPHISEYTYQHGSPQEWAGRIQSRTVVHTGGGTNMAMLTHHTVTRPKFPPGSINLGAFTLSRYSPKEDSAVEELYFTALKVHPKLGDLIDSLESYHLHTPGEGWVTTAGFVACANKAGLTLLRSELLALERSVPKDRMGRFNYYAVAEVVEAVAGAPQGEEGRGLSTAPEAVDTLRRSTGSLRSPLGQPLGASGGR